MKSFIHVISPKKHLDEVFYSSKCKCVKKKIIVEILLSFEKENKL
jgi:hypothetical protein